MGGRGQTQFFWSILAVDRKLVVFQAVDFYGRSVESLVFQREGKDVERGRGGIAGRCRAVYAFA